MEINLSDKSKAMMKPYSFSVTIPANGQAYVDVEIVIPAGFSLGSFSIFGGSSRNAVMLSPVLVSGNRISVVGTNRHSADQTVAGNINVLYYK